jgi:hypothetical protein
MSTLKNREVKYLNKDFSQFRNNLINFAKIYFPNTYNDFNESDPGMMFLEMASYVGDVLSYYADKQLKESMLPYAEERANVYAIAQSLGYKPKISIPSSARVNIYQLIPATAASPKTPDWNYALTVQPGLQLESTEGGVPFIVYNGVDFSFSSSSEPTNISVYSYVGSDPEYFLLEKSVNAISGELRTATFTFEEPKKFNKVLLADSDIINIYDVVDSDGNTWYEVPYLAQDTIFEKIDNTYTNDQTLADYASNVPYLLTLKRVPKRFVSRITSNNNLELQFGAGISDNADETIIPNPDNVGFGIPSNLRSLDLDYDPSNFMYTNAYGEVPANTTLTVRYLVGGGVRSNVGANTISKIGQFIGSTKNVSTTDPVFGPLATFIVGSLACSNVEAATGGRSGESVEEIRQNALATFGTQNRAVTLADYAVRAMSMPSDLGGVSKVHVTQDEQLSIFDLRQKIKNPLALNFYCLGYDINKNLITLNDAAKINLKTYLSQYKILTDAINIKNAYIVNIAVKFEVIAMSNYNANEVLLRCIQNLRNFFDIDKWQINQPIIKSEIYKILYQTPGVQTVSDLSFKNMYGQSNGYSNNVYDLKGAERKGIIYPSLDPCIFEVKYPNTDIVGRVTSI